MDVVLAIQLATEVIESVATVASNISSKGQGAAVSSALMLTSAALKAGEDGLVKLQQLKADIQAMVAGNREPTDDELSQLKTRSDAAHAAIQGS